MRKAESLAGQWALRFVAVLIVFAQGLFLSLYSLVPVERPAVRTNTLLLSFELVSTAFALTIIPTFLIWLSLSGEMESHRKRLILIATGLGAPLVTFFVLMAAI